MGWSCIRHRLFVSERAIIATGCYMRCAGGGRRRLTGAWLGVLIGMALVASGALAAELDDEALVEALRGGGYNIYFRHAATDWSQADQVERAGDWTSCDPTEMRQ